MKSKSIAFGLLLTLLCAGESHATVPLGAGFTYQGRLNDNGAPANGNYDMIFNLYDAPTNGSVLGSFSIFGAVPVTNGLFNVELNAYGEFGPNAFNGQSRWLQIGVRTNNNNAMNPWINLSPRQPLDPTPQAMFALNASNAMSASFAASVADGSITASKLAPGAVAWTSIAGMPAGFADGADNDTTYAAGTGLTLSGPNNQFSVNFAGGGSANSAARSDHQHFGVFWGGSAQFGNGLSVTNGAPNSAGLYGQQGTGSGFPYIFGNTAGVWGESSQGTGVHGASGYATGRGVTGFGVATNGANRGVYGASLSTAGTGVYGETTTTSGATAGVYGQSASTSGTGVRGVATATSGFTIGVRGDTASPDGNAVLGYASSLAGDANGVYGQSAAVNGVGVFGRATFVSGVGPNYGVIGQSDANSGYGVYGHAAASGGLNFGVVGQSDSASGIGVVAKNTSGVALKAAGTGIIQSDADSYIWIPGSAALYDNSYAQGVASKLEVWDNIAANFPLTVPAVLYGQRTVLKSIEIYYSCKDGSKGYINGTTVYEDDVAANYVYDDSASRTSNTRTSYTIPVNFAFNDSAPFIGLWVWVHASSTDWINIYGIKLRFGHQ